MTLSFERMRKVASTGVVPCQPGIPLLMPGENAGPADGVYLSYLRALQAWDRRFPGFEHENHGVETSTERTPSTI
jgi:arginine decarboxylase